MTDFHIDLVPMEHPQPWRPGLIRRFGAVEWEDGDRA